MTKTFKLGGARRFRFRYVPAIDDFVAQLDFHGHSLDLHMEWEGDVSLTADPAVPEQMFSQVADHLSAHIESSLSTGSDSQCTTRVMVRRSA